MKQAFWVFVLLFVAYGSLKAQNVFRTSVNAQKIKTLQVKVAGELISNPVIELNGEDQLEVSFDVLEDGYTRYAYSIVHCNADWTPSMISPIEFMSGFQGMEIEDFANSMATTTTYSNYRFFLPNEDVKLKLSGNYAVKIYEEGKPDDILATACFFVSERMVSIDARISGNTDIDVNKAHQQLDFVINHKDFPVNYPLSDLKLYVYQNDRRDNAVTGLKPSAIQQSRLVYSHLRELIFKGGNEYRRMEFLSNKYNGMGVLNVQFHNPYYHVTLIPDLPRNNRTYQYDQDQNGRFFIRCSNCGEPDIESDYYIVHFTLESDEIPGGQVYLHGQVLNNSLCPQALMEYNRERRQYEKSLLLKQGSYNYQYLFVPDGEAAGLTSPVEGDYAETENEYTVAVYYRPIGSRYDRLIGFSTVNNRMTVF